MKVSWPSHLSLLHQFKRLESILGGDTGLTKLVVFELWEHLTWEVEEHGAAGYIGEPGAFLLQSQLSDPVPDVMQKLTASGFLEKQKGGWFSALYAFYNSNLSKDHIPDDDSTSYKTFRAQQEIVGSAAYKIIEQLDPIVWLRETGQKLDVDFLKRCIMLVKTIDGIFGLGARRPAEFDAPLIAAATRVLEKWPKEKVEVVLLRMWQKKNTLGLTKRTAWALDNWDELICKVAPADGYSTWLTQRAGHVQEGG